MTNNPHCLIIIRQPLSDSVKMKFMKYTSIFDMTYICDGYFFVFANHPEKLIEFLQSNNITEYECPSGCMFVLSNKHQNLKKIFPTVMPIVYGNTSSRYFVHGFDSDSLTLLLQCKYPDFNPESLKEIKNGRY